MIVKELFIIDNMLITTNNTCIKRTIIIKYAYTYRNQYFLQFIIFYPYNTIKIPWDRFFIS